MLQGYVGVPLEKESWWIKMNVNDHIRSCHVSRLLQYFILHSCLICRLYCTWGERLNQRSSTFPWPQILVNPFFASSKDSAALTHRSQSASVRDKQESPNDLFSAETDRCLGLPFETRPCIMILWKSLAIIAWKKDFMYLHTDSPSTDSLFSWKNILCLHSRVYREKCRTHLGF